LASIIKLGIHATNKSQNSGKDKGKDKGKDLGKFDKNCVSNHSLKITL